MIDEDKLSKATARAVRAKNILESDIYQESYGALEAQFIADWIATDPKDVEGRERCFAQVQANRKQRDYFVSIVTNGKLAAAELKQIAETAERQSRYG